MNTLLLQPTDVLFFSDGRPMSGSLTGHTAAWPTPDVTDHALHAALHRSTLEGHKHRRGKSGNDSGHRDRRFGSVTSAGPFPVKINQDGTQNWFFSRPHDLQDATLTPAILPLRSSHSSPGNPFSSLKKPLIYSMANRLAPSKGEKHKRWISRGDFDTYLNGDAGDPNEAVNDDQIADTEQTIGIAIDPDTQTTGQGSTEGQIYSAHYLRLRENWRLGLFAHSAEKVDQSANSRVDIIKQLFPATQQIIIGGQQRTCTVQLDDSQLNLPMPLGKSTGFQCEKTKGWLIKWILLTPSIWPRIEENKSKGITEHPGGWLPTWVNPENGQVLLKNGDTLRRTDNREHRAEWRKRVADLPSIEAKLVSAVVPKPQIITGWANANPAAERDVGGAKSVHLAVPAGAVYYFNAATEEEATALATALNWHGTSPGTKIQNRRSSLLGEKGYGLGVCGRWEFYPTSQDVPVAHPDSGIK